MAKGSLTTAAKGGRPSVRKADDWIDGREPASASEHAPTPTPEPASAPEPVREKITTTLPEDMVEKIKIRAIREKKRFNQVIEELLARSLVD